MFRLNNTTKPATDSHRNGPPHRHQRGPQKPGKLSLLARLCGTRALMSLCPLQAFFLGHRVIRQIEPLGRWPPVQTEDECTVVADQIIGHGPCSRMINHPLKWNVSASQLHFGQQRDLQLRPCSSTKTLMAVEDSTSLKNSWVVVLTDIERTR